jgi:hypothetical protein
MLHLLQDRLKKWCETCLMCCLAWDRGKRHNIIDCLQYNTVKVIDQAVIIQRHINKFKGFQGIAGYVVCGIP